MTSLDRDTYLSGGWVLPALTRPVPPGPHDWPTPAHTPPGLQLTHGLTHHTLFGLQSTHHTHAHMHAGTHAHANTARLWFSQAQSPVNQRNICDNTSTNTDKGITDNFITHFFLLFPDQNVFTCLKLQTLIINYTL